MNERDVFANGALTLPRKISILKTAVRPSREPLTVHADLPPHPALARWLEEKRITRSQDGELAIALRPLKPADMQGWTLTPAAVEEGYIVELRFSDSRQQAIIGANSDRALGYALETLGALALDKWRVEARIEDYPAFAVRGIIEGFYGTPWPQRNRLDMLEFIARRKMNTYFYAPKDDPYHRRKWAKPYDPESLGKLKEVIEHARRLGLDFYYCLAPGLSMKYSDSEHLRLLKEKAKQIFDLGVRRFGLFFDDIPGKLQHADDRVRFSSLAEAHVHVCNAFYDALSGWDRDVRLAVCPTQYFGKGDESYIVELGRGLYPAIDLFWTGRQICSREITVDEAVRFQRFTGRPPLYWDNYPVNDARMTDEMHIGPYLGREAELYRFSRGLVSNGMEYPESSKIAFAAIADYLWNPDGYEPELSWKRSIRALVGEKACGPFLTIADNLRFSCLYPFDSPELSERLHDFIFRFTQEDRSAAAEELKAHIAHMEEALRQLLRLLQDHPILSELSRWLNKYSAACRLLGQCVTYLLAASKEKRDALSESFEQFRGDRTQIFADVVESFVQQALDGEWFDDET